MVSTLATLALFAALSSVSPTPGAVPPTVAEQVSVSEALLDVVVTGRDDRTVLGLGPDDFRVEVAGRDAAPVAATFYSNRRFLGDAAAAQAAGIADREASEGRIFVLFFHDQKQLESDRFSFVGQQLEAGRRAAEWVATGLLPGDRAAVVGFDSRLRLYADLTDDRVALREAVLAAVTGRTTAGDWPSRRASGSPGASELAARLPAGDALRDRTPRIYDALQLVADALAPVRGRKNLILFSRGIGELGAFGEYRKDPRYYTKTQETLNAANVAVYGVNTGPEPGLAILDGVSELASDTGGALYRIFVSFTTPLEQIAAATNGYYLLAVPTPDDAAPGSYVEAKVRCRNPELRCTGRQGFRMTGK